MHGHLRVGLAQGPSMGWVSDFFCHSLLCLPVLGPSLSFRSVPLHPSLFLSYLSTLSPAFSSYFFPNSTLLFRYFAFFLHFRVFPVYHLCLIYFSLSRCPSFSLPATFLSSSVPNPSPFPFILSHTFSGRYLPSLCLEWRYSGMLLPYYSGCRCLHVLDF